MDSQKFPRVDLIVTVIIFFLGLFLFGKFGPGLPLSINSVTTAQPAPFTVSAEGKVTAVPDIAQVSLGFTTTSPTVAEAQNQANQTINNISAAIKKLGINDQDIRTTNYSISPTYDFRSATQKITGYSVNINLEIKVRDFTKINSVIDAGAANGANQVGGLNFTFDNVEKYKSQARKVAIDNAKKKASEIAAQSGISLGRLTNVSETNQAEPRPIMMGLGAAEKAVPSTPTQVEPGSSEISVTVTLSYETR